MGRTVWSVLLVSVVWGVAAGASAQQLQTNGQNSNYGRVSLAAGFNPDPHSVTVTSGGTINVGGLNLGAGCTGFVTAPPDFIVNLTSQSSMLRFFVEASGDTALVINDARGGWRCDDDSGGGTNPMVSIQNAPPGQYDIWVASYRSGENISGALKVTERNITPGGGGAASGGGGGGGGAGQLDTGGQNANFGKVSLAPGFQPDPREVSVRSGGTINVSSLNLGAGCTGFVTRAPDYIVNLTGQSSMLRFFVAAPGDTALVINDARGGWQCNDDSYGGTNPTIDIHNAPPGQYDIWVASYRSGENVNGVLKITELQNQHP